MIEHFQGATHIKTAVVRTIAAASIFAIGIAVLAFISAAPAYAQGSFVNTGSLNIARSSHTATLLSNGQVLVAGGNSSAGTALASAELYNPATGKWSVTGSMATARYQHSATLLANGEVLIVGGVLTLTNQGIESCAASAEIYNPATGKFAATGSLPETRCANAATLLPSGQVLVVGGGGTQGGDRVALLFNPSSGTWSAAAEMMDPRSDPGATLLANGEVLVAGGGNPLNSAELYTSGRWILTTGMHIDRSSLESVLLPNGDVLVFGGSRLASYVSEYYNPATAIWTMTHGFGVSPNIGTLTMLKSGEVMVAAGANEYSLTESSSFYNASTNAWTRGPNLNNLRKLHTATLLANGDVLVAGGANTTSKAIASAELYIP